MKILVHLPKHVREEYYKVVQDLYKDNSLAQQLLSYVYTYYIGNSSKSFSYALEYTNNFDPKHEFIRTNNMLEGIIDKLFFVFNFIYRL